MKKSDFLYENRIFVFLFSRATHYTPPRSAQSSLAICFGKSDGVTP